jgi:hypothetical protein
MNILAARRLPGGTVARLVGLLGCAIALCVVLPCSAQTSGKQAASAPTPAAPTSATQSSATPSSTTQSSATPTASTPLSSSSSPAQSSSAAATSASNSAASAPEMNTRTSQVPLQSHVNLVPIRVVVHDGSGHAVENLRKEDFQVKQDGKVQFITHFSVETPASAASQVARGEAIPLPPDASSYAISDSSADAAGKAAGGADAGKLASQRGRLEPRESSGAEIH